MAVGMPVNRKSAVAMIVVCSFLFAVARSGLLRYWGQASRPVGQARRTDVPSAGISQFEKEHFLEGDFKIISDVRALPKPVLKAFTDKSGSRLLMANPGEQVEATDVVSGPSVPRMRLIFAGVLDDKSFVHYEQGGRGRMYILAFFIVAPGGSMKPSWLCYCAGPAANLDELRSMVLRNECSLPQ
jgi:hypothetical protein